MVIMEANSDDLLLLRVMMNSDEKKTWFPIRVVTVATTWSSKSYEVVKTI